MALRFQSGFEVAKLSDLEYDGMAVEIRLDGVPLAELNRDKGKYSQEIEIPSRFSPESHSFVFPLNDFIEALEAARNLLETLE